jgi:hypothetical protein
VNFSWFGRHGSITRRLPCGMRVGRQMDCAPHYLTGGYFMKKMLLWLTLTAVMGLLLASPAAAQYDAKVRVSAANPTATVTKAATKQRQPCPRLRKPIEDPSLAASYTPGTPALMRPPCIYFLRKTGGPSLVVPLTLGALAILVGSGVVIRALVRG